MSQAPRCQHGNAERGIFCVQCRGRALVATARRAMGLMTPGQRAEAETLLNELDADAPPQIATHADLQRLSAGFAADMQPVCRAIVGALHDGDLQALLGLKAMLPTLLHEVNASPVLADLLAHQLGQAVLSGLTTPPEGAR